LSVTYPEVVGGSDASREAINSYVLGYLLRSLPVDDDDRVVSVNAHIERFRDQYLRKIEEMPYGSQTWSIRITLNS